MAIIDTNALAAALGKTQPTTPPAAAPAPVSPAPAAINKFDPTALRAAIASQAAAPAAVAPPAPSFPNSGALTRADVATGAAQAAAAPAQTMSVEQSVEQEAAAKRLRDAEANRARLELYSRTAREYMSQISPELLSTIRRISREDGIPLPLAAQNYGRMVEARDDEEFAALAEAEPALGRLASLVYYNADVISGEGVGVATVLTAARNAFARGEEVDSSTAAGDAYAGGLTLEATLLSMGAAISNIEAQASGQAAQAIGATIPEWDKLQTRKAEITALLEQEGLSPDQQDALNLELEGIYGRTTELELTFGMRFGTPQAALESTLEGQQQAYRDVGLQVVEAMALAAEASAIPNNPSAERLGKAITLEQGLTEVLYDPAGVIRSLGLRALPSMAPPILAGAAGTLIGGPVGAAALGGIAGGSVELGSSVQQGLQEDLTKAGVDISSPEAVTAWAQQNEDKFADLIEKAVATAAVIAAVDAATGGLGGRVVQATAGLSTPARLATQFATDTVLEGVGEGGGSAAAQYVTEGTLPTVGQTLSEMLAGSSLGAPSAAVTVGAQLIREGMQGQAGMDTVNTALRDQLEARAAAAEDVSNRLRIARAAVEDTAVFVTDPETIRTLLQTDDEDDVYVPAAEIARLYQEGALTDKDIQYLNAEEELTQQGEISGDVAVKRSNLLTLQGGAFAALADHVRVTPEGTTAAEARANLANLEGEAARLEAKMGQLINLETEVEGLTTQIYDSIPPSPQVSRRQRQAVSRLMAQRYVTRAGLFGPEVTAQSLYEADQLTFQNQQGTAGVQQPAAPQEAPSTEVAPDQTAVGPQGLLLLHGTTSADLTTDNIQIMREGAKQGRRGRTTGGFYMTSVADAAQAEGYAAMSGAQGQVMDVLIAPDTKILQFTGDITRLSETQVNEWTSQGYGLVIGKDVRGRTEYVVINRDAIQNIGPRGTVAQSFEQAKLVDEQNRVAELRRPVSELRAYAEQQADWRDWYDRYQALLEDMFGQDADLIRQILGATSQAASVPANVGLAIKAYEQMLSGQPFTGYLPAVIKNLDRIRAQVALAGQKIGQYGAAVSGDDDAIAIDRHVAMIMFDTKSPTAAQVELGKQTVREIAAQLGWKAREVQAALWAANIARSGKEPQSYDTYLVKKAEQVRAIRAAFPTQVAGGSGAGVRAGGDTGAGIAESGGFEQSPLYDAPDTSVAGGLTEKSLIKTRSLLGARITPMFADLTSAGNVFDKLDGMPVAPTPYFGGPNFPWLKAYKDSGVVWAFNAKGVITGLRNRVRAMQAQSIAEGNGGRVVVTMLAMKDDAHTSNEMTISALLRTLDAVIAAGRFPPAQLEAARKVITHKAPKKGNEAEVDPVLSDFPSLDDAQAIADWSRSASFEKRKAAVSKMRSAAFRELDGMFPVERIVREAIDPDYRATQVGDALLAFEIDPDRSDLIIDWDERAGLAADLKKKLDKAETKYTQAEIDAEVSAQIVAKYGEDVTEAEKNPDIPRHPAYRYGMRGTLVGSFSTHIPMEVLYGDLLPEILSEAKAGSEAKFLMERLGGALDQTATIKAPKNPNDATKVTFKLDTGSVNARRVRVSVTDPVTPENKNPTPRLLTLDADYTFAQEYGGTDGTTKMAFVTLNTALPAGSKVNFAADAQSQLVTEDVVKTAETIEGLHDYRIAQAYTAGLSGTWRSTDAAANKGGVNPAEFIAAIRENDAASTLSQYSAADLTAGKKDGSLRVFQLGDARVQDGGLNVWMAVQKGVDYRNVYPSDVTDALVADGVLTENEVALVGVASNELGVKGMATFQVLKAVEEGVTVLDAYKVKSASKPDGLLPTIYATLGFEEVGSIPFDPQYLVDADALKAEGKSDAEIEALREGKLNDLKAVWGRQSWVEADGYPAVAIMKWRGDDAARSEATKRFVLEGQDGLGIRGASDIGELQAAQSSVSDSVVAGDQGDGVTRQGDGRADPRRYADRARDLSSTARGFVANVLAADAKATTALKLPRDAIARIRKLYGSTAQPLEQSSPTGPQTSDKGAVGAPRGSYVPPTSMDPRNLINLTTTADVTTFVHEGGHMFLFQMMQDLADPRLTPEGRATLTKQVESMRGWFGRNADQGLADLKRMSESATKRAAGMPMGAERDQATLRAMRLTGAYNRAAQNGGPAYMQGVAAAFMDPTAVGHDEAAEVVFHELWARGFEQYMGTGNAPTSELAKLFAQFSKFITTIYKSLRRLNVEITPEISDVFDRLLAGEEALQAERSGSVYQVPDAVFEGATPAEAKRLRELAAAAETEASTLMQSKIASSLRAEEVDKRNARREQLTVELTEQVQNEPVYTAATIARTGITPNGDQKIGNGPLAYTEVAAFAGEATADALPKGTVTGKKATPKNPISLGMLRDLSGYETTEDMLLELGNPDLESKTAKIKRLVEEQMVAEFGDDTDMSRFKDQAIEISQNDKFQQLQVLLIRILRRMAEAQMTTVAERQTEQRGAPSARADVAAGAAADTALASATTPQDAIQAGLQKIRSDVQKRANVKGRRAQRAAALTAATIRRGIDPEAIKLAASRFVAKSTVGTMTPLRFRQAAQRLTVKLEQAIAARNYTEAAALMEQRAMNLAVAEQAAIVQNKLETKRKAWSTRLNRTDKRLAASYDMDHVNTIRALMQPFGFAREASKNYNARAALSALSTTEPDLYNEMMMALTQYAQITLRVQQSHPKDPIKGLTVLEFEQMLDLAERLLAGARDSKGILINGERVAFTQIGAEVDANVQQRRKVQKAARARRVGRGGKALRTVKRNLSGFKAMLRRIELWAKDIDNGNPMGPVTQYLVRPVMEAVDTYLAARQEPQRKLLALIKGNAGLQARRPIRAPELGGYTFQNRGELLMAVLHTGNDSNKRKLLLGGAEDIATGEKYVWGTESKDGTLDTSRWDTFLQRMFDEGVITKTDMDFVQGVWDLFETTKSAAQEAHKRMYGYYFAEIEATPVQTPFGGYKGGYAPAVTDTMMNPDGDRFEAEQVMSQQSNAAMFPSAEKGFTQGRVEYNRPLDLDMSRIPSHLDRVMKFAHLGPAVRNAARLVKNSAFSAAIRVASPDVIDVAVIPWLQRTVQQRVTTPPTNRGWGGVDKIAQAINNRVGLHLMAGNILNAAQQVTGFSVAAAVVPVRHLVAALSTFRVNGQGARAHMISRSSFMAERMSDGSNEVATTLENYLSENTMLDAPRRAAEKVGYIAQQVAQNLIDPTVWLAAERHALNIVYPDVYAKELDKTGDEAAADEAATKAVIFYADSVVRQTQAPLRPSDISAIEASSPLARLFLKFYSYFNAMGNLLVTERNIAQNAKIGWTSRQGRAFYAYLMIVAVPSIVAESMSQALKGNFDDLEEEDDIDQLMFDIIIGSQIKTTLATVPYVGQVGGLVYGVAATDVAYDDKLSMPAGLSVVSGTVSSLTKLIMVAADPDTDVDTKKAIKTTLDAFALVSGIPTNWLSKPLQYAAEVHAGKSKPEGMVDILQGALTGKDGTE